MKAEHGHCQQIDKAILFENIDSNQIFARQLQCSLYEQLQMHHILR